MPYKDTEIQKQAQADWYRRNKAVVDKRVAKWRKANPELRRVYKQKETEFGRHQRKALIQYKGGKCEECGFEDDGTLGFLLDFHHIDPALKKFGISAGNLRKKMSLLMDEADKCQLLCVMCHRIHHHKQGMLNNGNI